MTPAEREGTPLYPEALTGWKAWTVREAEQSMAARPWAGLTFPPGETEQPEDGAPAAQLILVTGGNYEWPAGEAMVASCRMGADHRSPDPACTCGIYAARSLPILRSRRYAAGPHDDAAPDVVGEVAMWGRVMESTEILRSEFAYPKRLYVAHTRWQIAKPLRDAYGIPVEIRNPFTMDDPQEGAER